MTFFRNISSGKTPLHLAADGGHDTVLQFLVEHPQTPADAIDILDSENVIKTKINIIKFYNIYFAVAYSALSGLQQRA